MRIILFIYLFLPFAALCQRKEHIVAFQKSIPVGLGEPVHLPDLLYNPDFPLEEIADYNIKQRVLVITTDSLYRKIFRRYEFTKDSLTRYINGKDSSYYFFMCRYLKDSVPDIDFSKKELILYSACGQCLAFCHHDENASCHRNVCVFMYAWFLRNRQDLKIERN